MEKNLNEEERYSLYCSMLADIETGRYKESEGLCYMLFDMTSYERYEHTLYGDSIIHEEYILIDNLPELWDNRPVGYFIYWYSINAYGWGMRKKLIDNVILELEEKLYK